MERPPSSGTKTPLNNLAAQRRSKSKSYRLSVSRLGLTQALTPWRLNTSRRAPKIHNITEKVNADQLALLVKTEWKLSYVTPLYQFKHIQLDSYSRQLSAFIAAEKQQGLAVEVEAALKTLRASFSVVHGMAESENDAETVLIQIHSKPLFASRDEPQKMVWSGWLTCINGDPDYLLSLPADFTCLPLFGSSGAEGLTALVKSWFQKSFDCCFGPLEINHTCLQWLIVLWTNCHKDSSIQHLKMMWTIPAVPPLQITYAVNPDDAWDLWSSVRKGKEGKGGEEAEDEDEDEDEDENEDEDEDEDEDCIDIEEVMRFMEGLKSHFFRHFRLDLSAGNLNLVSTALGSAKYNGRIKISNSRYMITTLTLLTECAFLKMPF